MIRVSRAVGGHEFFKLESLVNLFLSNIEGAKPLQYYNWGRGAIAPSDPLLRHPYIQKFTVRDFFKWDFHCTCVFPELQSLYPSSTDSFCLCKQVCVALGTQLAMKCLCRSKCRRFYYLGVQITVTRDGYGLRDCELAYDDRILEILR